MLPVFQVPSEADRKRALGALAGSNFTLRKSVSNLGDFFPAIDPPGPGDWLSEQFEHGQTASEFHSYANVPGDSKLIIIQPIGRSLPAEMMKLLKKYCTALFLGMKFKVLRPIQFADMNIESRENEFGTQYNAGQLLGRLSRHTPLKRFAVIAVTMNDLYNEESWNFVFGLANVMTKMGIFSFARYDPAVYNETAEDPEQLILLRAAKVMSHELGHMFGLLHCIYYKCCMNGTNGISETDKSPLYLCPVCLRKLHTCLNFNPLVWYAKLEMTCQSLGPIFLEAADWFRRRRESIESSMPHVRGAKKA
mmetsp:Transcript_8063/g.15867  ORF Transcript_8063/g.15867 Transcript_8063/m.15867 type:complete len:307 (+) Transcript_8063:13971-14891(+)